MPTSITEFAIERNRVTLVALFVIFLAASLSYINMPRAEDPDFTIRTAQIVTRLPGASPKRMEELVTDKIEKAAQEIPELDHVRSISKTGVSIVYVKIQERYQEMRPIWDNLRRKVEDVEPDLPNEVIGPFVNDEFGDVYGIVISIIGEDFNYSELKGIADNVRDEFLRLEDVSRVDIIGEQNERIFLEYDNTRLAELGLSPGQLVSILSSRNIINPGGQLLLERERIAIEPSGNFESVADVKNTLISIPGTANLMYLKDLVNVKSAYVDPPSNSYRSSGINALALAVSMSEVGNIIRLGEDTQALLARLQSIYPIGIEFDLVAYQPERVEYRVNSFVSNLLQAVSIVSAVMLIFLGIRTGLIVASLVPAAILSCFLLMNAINVSLNQISLAALIISLGMLVDNAIVMVESIMVQSQQGKTVKQACIDSAGELRIPLLTSSLTTAAAFLPQFLAESSSGEYTQDLFKVVSITLLSSWVLALTMVPLLCVWFLKTKGGGTQAAAKQTVNSVALDNRFYRYYRVLLLSILKHPLKFLLFMLLALFFAMQGFKQLPKIFFPETDRTIITGEIELPFGTAIETTAQLVSDVEEYFRRELLVSDERPDGIVNWGSFIGSGGTRFLINWNPEPPTPEYAHMIINTVRQDNIDELAKEIEAYIFNNFPDATANFRRTYYGPPVDVPVAVRFLGEDADLLFKIAAQAEEKLSSIAGSKNVGNDWGAWSKKVRIDIDEARAWRVGITNQDIATSLQASFSGIETTQYRDGDELVPVVLRSVAADRHDVDKLSTINVFSQSSGRSVPLTQVADIELIWEPGKILRRDRLKTITVESQLTQGTTANEVMVQLLPWLEEQSKTWPLGYRYELGGEFDTSSTASNSIRDKLPIGGLIILLLLVWQFNGLRKPAIILMTIPFSLIGVVIGLLAVNSYFGFMTFLGVISLAGIVINNAIVLIDRIRIEQEIFQRTPQDAIVQAAQRRMRPILLTTATTVLGLIPLWFGGGAMWEPMAVAIIFGLSVSTLLTLGLVPVLYSLLYRVSYKNYKL